MATDDGDLRQMPPDATRRLHEAVDRAPGLFRRAHGPLDPAAGSSAATDQRTIAHARWVVAGAAMSLAVATDHLLAWRTIVKAGEITTFAPMTLLRAAMEGAFSARWVLDRRVAPIDRVARGVAWQVEDYRQRASFEAAAKARSGAAGIPDALPTPPGRTAEQRRAELSRARDESNIPRVAPPRMTDIAREYGAPGDPDTSWLYRLVSAFAHGQPWSTHATSLGETHTTGVEGLNRARVGPSDLVLVGTTVRTVRLVGIAMDELEEYLGSRP